jgi:NTP pyrophosphatase (non-canonical NTP hydrolase)
MKAKDIALEALEVFGPESQVKRFAEECVEAAHAALKFDRTADDTRLVAEIGDLKLVLWQMEQFLGEDRIRAATRRSALKLEKMVMDARELSLRFVPNFRKLEPASDYSFRKLKAMLETPNPILTNLGPIPPLDAGLYEATDKETGEPVQMEVKYEVKPCGCCARPKELGRGLEILMGDGK